MWKKYGYLVLRARGDNTERADIDLAIVCPEAKEAEWLRLIAIIETADTFTKN
jgi:uncharacterized protein